MSGNPVALGWQRTFKLSWIIGFCGGASVYWLISLVSPPPGAPYVIELLETSSTVIEATHASDGEATLGSDIEKK